MPHATPLFAAPMIIARAPTRCGVPPRFRAVRDDTVSPLRLDVFGDPTIVPQTRSVGDKRVAS